MRGEGTAGKKEKREGQGCVERPFPRRPEGIKQGRDKKISLCFPAEALKAERKTGTVTYREAPGRRMYCRLLDYMKNPGFERPNGAFLRRKTKFHRGFTQRAPFSRESN